jgi:hypothetical protein
MSKNLIIIIALTLLLSLATGFGVVSMRINRELAAERDHAKAMNIISFQEAMRRIDVIVELEKRLEKFRVILRRHKIKWHEEEPGIVLELAPNKEVNDEQL